MRGPTLVPQERHAPINQAKMEAQRAQGSSKPPWARKPSAGRVVRKEAAERDLEAALLRAGKPAQVLDKWS